MKKSYIIIVLIITLVFLVSCSKQLTDNKETPYYAESMAQLNKIQQYNGQTYYIDPFDNKLYMFDEKTKESVIVLDDEILRFAYTKEYLIYVDATYNLVISDLTMDTDCTVEGEIYGGYGFVYDDRVVFISQDSSLVIAGYDGSIISKRDDKEIKKLVPYKDKFCYVIINDKLLTPNSIMLMDLNGNYNKKVEDEFVYSITARDEWIYYVDDKYTLTKINPEEGTEAQQVRFVDLFNWGMGTDFLVSNDYSDGLFVCDLNGEKETIIEADRQEILAAENNIFIYQKADSENIVIYNVETNTKSIIELRDEDAKCIISDSVIYVVFGHYTDEDYIETSGGLYSYNGELLYEFNYSK